MILRVLSIVSLLFTVLGIIMIILNAINFKKFKDNKVLKARFVRGSFILGIGIVLPYLIGLLHIVFPSEGILLIYNLSFLLIKLAGLIIMLLLFAGAKKG